MAVREFDGTDDRIDLSVGSLSTLPAPWSAAFIVKKGGDGAWRAMASTGATGSRRHEWKFSNTNLLDLGRHGAADSQSTFTVTVADGWVLLGIDKALGTTIPRFHKFRYSDTTWTHQDGSAALANYTADVNQLRLGAVITGIEFFNGKFAVAGIWLRQLSDIEWEGLTDSLQAWVDESPDALWPLNQESVATPVDDITGGGANQTAITGTTVVTGDDPPGFDFTLGPVRNFGNFGSGDRIQTAIGGLASATAFGTYAAIFKRNNGTDSNVLIDLHDGATTDRTAVFLEAAAGEIGMFQNNGGVYTNTTVTVSVANGWVLVAQTKASGTVVTRGHRYIYGTSAWTHTNAGTTAADGTAPGAGGNVKLCDWTIGNESGSGRIAVAAVWAGVVLADLDLEGLTDSLQAWLDLSPTALWAFNQASIATPVEDLTGNGANETAISGTTVITTDAPPGFDFTLAAPAVPNRFVTGPNLQLI